MVVEEGAVVATKVDFKDVAPVPVFVGVAGATIDDGVGVIVVDATVVVVISAVDDTDDLFVVDLDLDLVVDVVLEE